MVAATNAPATLQWTLVYPPTAISSVGIAAGAALTAAGDTLTCASASGSVTCVATGPSAKAIGSGMVGVVTANLSASSSSTLDSLALSGVFGALPNGFNADMTGIGGTITVLPTVSGLHCSLAAIASGGSTTCTVTLSLAAPSGGTLVTLSDNSSTLNVPASVTVPAGATSASFQASAGTVTTAQSATITASYSGTSATTGLSLTAATVVSALTCSPSSLGANSSTTCTVSLSQPAPSGGAVVTLANSNATLTVPASVTVAASATSATFKATTAAIGSNSTATITASYSGASVTAAVTLTATVLVSTVSCNPGSLGPNSSSTCTVTLSQPAPAGGATVTLSDTSSLVTTPASATVPAGATSATFTVTTGILSLNSSATITATYNGSSASAGISLVLLTLPTSLVCAPATLAAGASSICTLILNQLAPLGGISVSLTNSNTLAVSVPVSITVPVALSTAIFTVTAANVATAQTATIKATVGSNSVSTTLNVAAAIPPISFVQANAKVASTPVKNLAASFVAPTKAGDLVLVGLCFTSNATFASITDTQGNAFIQLGKELISPGGAHSLVYYTNKVKGAADTVTINLSGKPSYAEIYLAEYTGVDPTSPIDSQAGASGSAGAAASGNITTRYSDDLIFGFCVGDDYCTVGTGFKARSTVNANLVEDMSSGNPGSYAATGIADSGWTMQMVALKPAKTIIPTNQLIKAPARTMTATIGASEPMGARGTTAPAPTTLSLLCLPKQLDPGRVAICTLKTAANADPYAIQLASSSRHLSLPSAVMTRANQTSLTFQVNAAPAAPQELVTIGASAGASTVQDTIQVAAFSRPIVTAPTSVTARRGTAIRFTVSADDPAGLPVQLRASSLPDGATFDAATGDFAWIPAAAFTGRFAVSFTATNAVSQSSSKSVPIDLTSGTPLLTALERSCSPGALDSLSGSSLAEPGSALSDPSGNSTELGGTKITVNGQYVPVISTAPAEVQFLCPSLPAGSPLEIRAETKSGTSDPLSAEMKSASPWVLPADGAGENQGAVSFPDTKELAMARNGLLAAHPAQPGDEIVIRASGLGIVSDASSWTVSVQVGGVDAEVKAIHALADHAGVYAVQVRVPTPLAFGDAVPVQVGVIAADGNVLRSNTASMALEPAGQ